MVSPLSAAPGGEAGLTRRRARSLPRSGISALRSRSGGIAIGVLVCLVVPSAPAAHASGPAYGELTRFGEGGDASGHIDDSERFLSGGELLRAHLIGVDPTDNSVYVLDEPEEFSGKRHKPSKAEEKECAEEEIPPAECGTAIEGPVTRHFRIQKFSASGGAYAAIASAQFTVVSPQGRAIGGERLAVEGIAVDPRHERLYVLAVDERERSPDFFARIGSSTSYPEPVAAELLAFSTRQVGKELVAAGKTGKGAVLAGPGETELAAQSSTPGKPLLEPAGITVDPETGDVIIVAHEDPSSSAVDNIYEELEKPSPDHYLLQRVSPAGEVIAGPTGRWVDSADFFEHRERKQRAPNSPVVVGPEGAEQLDLEYDESIVRVPIDFSPSVSPETVFVPSHGGVSEGFIRAFPFGGDALELEYGGALAASPDGATIYASTPVINQQLGSELGQIDTAVVGISSATYEQTGWAGAQDFNAPRSGGEPKYQCVINPTGSEYFTPVAAGSEGKVFVLALEYLEKAMLEAHEFETYAGPQLPTIIELGPGGGGCPQASTGGLVAELDGEPLGERTVTSSEPVTFTSFIRQADANTVEWEFGDGTSETVSGQFRCPPGGEKLLRECPSVVHTFSASGRLTVNERVYTDDLSTPTVTQQTVVDVAGGAQGPVAVPIGPLSVTVGQEASFDGRFSFDPAGPNQIREYRWAFGDGTEATTAAPAIGHIYTRAGAYTVSLSVTDASGLTSLPVSLPHAVAVLEEEHPSPPATQIATGSSLGDSARSAPRQAVPDVTLASGSATVSKKGALTLTLRCPSEESGCSGELRLQATVSKASRRGKRRAARATIATSPFSLHGGQHKSLAVVLTRAGRALLAHARKIVAQVTISAHDPVGAAHTTSALLLLYAARPAHHR